MLQAILVEPAPAWRWGSVALPDYLGFQPQPSPQFESDSFCPTKGGVGLTLGCVLAGITVIDRKLRKKKKAAPKRLERRVVGQEQIEQVGQIVSAGYGRAELLQKRLEVLLRSLLAVKADHVRERWRSCGESSCARLQVAFRLAYPAADFHLHTRPFLSP